MNFEQILAYIQSQNALIIYGALLVSAFIENIFPPFPGDTVTLAGAFLAGSGTIGYIEVLACVTAGGIIGVMSLYYIGLSKGREFFEEKNNRFFGRDTLHKVESLYDKYGNIIIVISRFLAGIRSAVAIAAGLGNVKPSKMFFLTVIANLIWNGLLVGLMIITKRNWNFIIGLVKQYNIVVISIIILLIVFLVVRKWLKRKK